MKKYFLAILLTVLTTFAFSSRAGAVSDITYTLTEASHSSYELCDSVSSCSGYNYLIVTYNFVASDNIPIRIRLNHGNTNDIVNIPKATSSVIYELNPGTSSVYYFEQSSTNLILTGTNTITFTLTNSLDTEPCPTCPEVLPPDRSAIMDDFHNVFLNTFVGVIPISAIIFVVWFMIDMLSSLIFGRGK